VFLPETQVAGETRILLVDGHGSHAQPNFMVKCIENNVKVIYLIPHASHVLQPLDLSCFSAIKSRYRDQIANLSRYDDTAQIKKIRFIQYYQRARQEGLNPAVIMAGWRAAGIVPWDPRKVIRSSQVPQNDPIISVRTPKRRRQLSFDARFQTPQNRRDFDRLIGLLPPLVSAQRSVRTALHLASKAVDRFHHQNVLQSKELEAYELLHKERENKKQKKVGIDANKAFATAEQIIATKAVTALQRPAWEARKKAQEARELANTMLANDVARFTSEFYIGE
jgi:hypothetical protein